MNIQRLHEIFQTVSLSHISVNSFGTGELFELDVNGNDTFVTVWLDQPFIINAQGKGIDNYQFRLLVLDKPDSGETQEIQLISKCKNIGDEILYKINQDYSQEITINDTYTITSVTEYTDSNTCGVIIEGSFTAVRDIVRCNINYLFTDED